MYRNDEHYYCPTEGEAISNVIREKKTAGKRYNRYRQERVRKRHQSYKQCRKASRKMTEHMAIANERFIRLWPQTK